MICLFKIITFEPETLEVDQRPKRLGLSLVSNENFSEIVWPSGWVLGQATWAKMGQKLIHLWRHSQKIRNPQPKNFFWVQTRRLSDTFEPLNSSLVQSVEELGYWWGNRQLLVLAKIEVRIYRTLALKVLSLRYDRLEPLPPLMAHAQLFVQLNP